MKVIAEGLEPAAEIFIGVVAEAFTPAMMVKENDNGRQSTTYQIFSNK